jgi:hypothetical protein
MLGSLKCSTGLPIIDSAELRLIAAIIVRVEQK